MPIFKSQITITPDYQIDPNTNEISVPFNSKEVNTYNIEGQFLRNIKLPEFRSNAILLANSKFYVSRREAPTDSYVPLEVYLPQGTKYKEYSIQLPEMVSNPASSPYTELSFTPYNDVTVNILCHDTTFVASARGDWKPFIVLFLLLP